VSAYEIYCSLLASPKGSMARYAWPIQAVFWLEWGSFELDGEIATKTFASAALRLLRALGSSSTQ